MTSPLVRALGRALSLSALALLSCGGSETAESEPDDTSPIETEGPIVVETEGGKVEGYKKEGASAFLGIPYAAPPTGSLRWKAPKPHPGWSETLVATVRPKACPQVVPVLGATGVEDCLFVNVHAPFPAKEKAPVMVWIHGGGFTLGEGVQTDGGTMGERIAARTGAIVVSMNYRLGALGFLAHSALSAEDPSLAGSGNYGLEDQVAALEWVSKNIAAFGGDPGNVTIFGQSAGSISICTLLTAPSAAGLFSAAIMESGSCTLVASSLAAAEAQGDRFATNLGCDEASDVLACMREKSIEEVRDALPPDPNFISAGSQTFGSWMPIVDGRFVPEQPAAALASGDFYAVPSIVGFTRDEGRLFVALAYDMQGAPLDAAGYEAAVASLVLDPAVAAQIVEKYPLTAYDTPGEALAEVLGDALFACPGRELRSLIAAKAPVYAYQFDYPNAPFQLPTSVDLGAYHAAEVQFVFQHPAELFSTDFEGEALTFSHEMTDRWAHYASARDPNVEGLPTWPKYDDVNEGHLSLDIPSSPSAFAKKDACAFWSSIDYLRAPL